VVAVVGDSTFLHMGLQGLLDIVYNQGNVHPPPLFFSRHPAGLKIWRNIKRVEPSGQRTLF